MSSKFSDCLQITATNQRRLCINKRHGCRRTSRFRSNMQQCEYSRPSQYAQIQQSTHYQSGSFICAWWCVLIIIVSVLLLFSLVSNVVFAVWYFQRIEEVCYRNETLYDSMSHDRLLSSLYQTEFHNCCSCES
jgi:hypothetical protein